MQSKIKPIYLVPLVIFTVLIGFLVGAYFGGGSEEANDKNDASYISSRYISKYQNNLQDLTTQNLLKTETKEPIREENIDSKEGIIVEDANRQVIKTNQVLDDNQIQQIETEYNIEFINDRSRSGVYSIRVDDNSNLISLNESAIVESLEIDKPVKLLAQTTDWGIKRIGAEMVWDRTDGTGIVVAVIDTGVQIDHTDLTNNISSGYDFVNDDNEAYDDNGHGTHVAGIISAYNNSEGVIGGSYNSKIMPVKVLNSSGYGYLSDVAEGIYYATDNGANIINLSLGGNDDSVLVRDAIRYASRNGVLLVGAAGNSGGEPCVYPAAYDEVICVMATDQDNKLATFSNIGGDLSAPGVSNYSTYINNQFAFLSGTSMAAPHVAAAASLVFDYCNDCTSTDVRNILQDNAVDLGDPQKDIIFGYGLVDLVAAIDFLDQDDSEEEIIVTPTEEPQTEPTEEPREDANFPTKPPKSIIQQRINIISPTPEVGKKINFDEFDDVEISFELNPLDENSPLREITVYLDNEEVYNTDQQQDSYIIEDEGLTDNQYFVKVIAEFSNGRKSQDMIILDFTQLKERRENSRENPNAKRRVLGIINEFEY